MADRSATILPRGLYGEADAALWLGISPSTLRGLPIRRKKLGGRRLYDARDLEAFRDSLPYEGEDKARQSCDAAFG